VVLPQVPEQPLRAVLVRDVLERAARHKLDHAVERARREDAVRSQLEVEVFLAQEAVHERKELDDELVLSEVVPVLEDDGERLAAVARQELQPEREEVRLEDARRVGVDARDRDARVEWKRDRRREGAQPGRGRRERGAQFVDLLGAGVLGQAKRRRELRDARDELALPSQRVELVRFAWALELRVARRCQGQLGLMYARGGEGRRTSLILRSNLRATSSNSLPRALSSRSTWMYQYSVLPSTGFLALRSTRKSSSVGKSEKPAPGAAPQVECRTCECRSDALGEMDDDEGEEGGGAGSNLSAWTSWRR